MASVILSAVLLVLVSLFEIQGKAFVKLCYFPNWASQRTSEYARFDVEHIDASLCSHIVYAFAALDADSLRIVPRYADEDPSVGQPNGRHRRFNDLKKSHRHLKTLISIGGEYDGSDQFVAIARSDKSLQRFAQTTVEFLRQRDFDGLDVDWEYPNATTKPMFSRLLKTLRTAFEEDTTGGERLLLTVALPAGRHRIDEGFDIGAITRYVDLASLMTYDYHGSWSTLTGFDSPLYSRRSNPQFNAELSTEWTVTYYTSLGLPVDKMVVGVTAAGTRFKLQDLNMTGVGAPVVQTDEPRLSDLWQLPDRYAYPEICRVLQTANKKRVFDEEQQVPYVYHNDDWFGYEDVTSLKSKMDWMLKKGVAGVMFWALDMDDFTGKVCEEGRYPLLTAIRRAVDRGQSQTQLTEDVNPDIHYLTPYNAACPGARAASSRVFLACVLVLVLVWLWR